MITFGLSPHQIPQGQPADLRLSVMNSGDGRCTRIIGDLIIPSPMLLIRGVKQIELAQLDPGEQYQHPLTLKARRTGAHSLVIQGLSYRGPDGRTHVTHRVELLLEVTDQPQAVLPGVHIHVELHPTELCLNTWQNLTGWVHNQGDRALIGLTVQIQGAASSQPGQLPTLSPGSRLPFTLAIYPRQSGGRVPVRIVIASQSGAIQVEQVFYLNVSAGQAAPGTLIVQGDLTYGTKQQTDFHGDAVLIKSSIGSGGTDEGPPHCPGCHVIVDPEARFCSNCGTKLSDSG